MSVESSQFTDIKHHADELPSAKKDFDDLLKLAVTLQEQCDRATQRIFVFRMGQAAIILIGLFLGAVFPFYIAGGRFALQSELGGIVVALGYAAAMECILRKITTRRKRDQRAVREVVELLRDTERSVAVDQDLSVLQRAKLRVQLSRFDI
jgi:hypothetical protein